MRLQSLVGHQKTNKRAKKKKQTKNQPCAIKSPTTDLSEKEAGLLLSSVNINILFLNLMTVKLCLLIARIFTNLTVLKSVLASNFQKAGSFVPHQSQDTNSQLQ